MASLEWQGEYAYMKATNAQLTLAAGVDYSFTSISTNSLDTGRMGQFLSADWYEGPLDRYLRFGFFPRSTDGGDPISDAKNSGWTLSSVDARDNDEEDILFRESFIDWDLRPTTVATSTSDQLFSCQKFTVTLKDAQYGDDVGIFTADDVLFGAFLGGGYDPTAMEAFNPCSGTGQECRAEDGVVYCGDQIYDPDDRGPPESHLDYYGPNSFLDAVDAVVNAPGTQPNYSFLDYKDRMPEHNSGYGGDRITRETWEEDHSGIIYDRDLRFFFVPTGGSSGSTDYERARESGYRIFKLQLRDSGGVWQTWENVNSMMNVPVNSGFDYYDCEKIEFDLPDGMNYRSEFSWIGGYLEDGYDFTRLRPYNPCRELPGYSGTCRATNGIVFCGGVEIDPDATLPPSPTTPTPPSPSTPAPTPAPTTEKSGVTLDWRGDRAYLSGNNAEADVAGAGPAFTFVNDDGTIPTTETNDGMFLQHGNNDWFENNNERSVYFAAYSATSGSAKPLVLVESKMMQDNRNWVWWTQRSGSFTESMIVIPQGYDAFMCDRAEFTYRKENGSSQQVLGTFVVDDFRFGNFLSVGYNPNSLNYFNPCMNLPDPGEYNCLQGRECRCDVLDGQVSCNGIDVPFEDLYSNLQMPTTLAGTGVGALSDAATTFGRRSFSVSVAVALVTAAALHGGLLF